ncbi:hypothetical protein THOG11_10066 [Vibrio harveyi]|nr:hypothetical protein VCHENC01_1366 [Vibrio harveyi]CAH1547495.1 hypothetical protein THOD03_10067 [Vibrio harveyi]CAH1548666.1 hypothetical protein THOG11_10066 [Vibrio harveyi]
MLQSKLLVSYPNNLKIQLITSKELNIAYDSSQFEEIIAEKPIISTSLTVDNW